MKVGFIGLGLMGSRMAANILSNGYKMIVYNRTKEKAKPLVDKGAKLAETPAEVGKNTDIVFTMLATPDAVKATALGKEGFLASMKNNNLWVDCSTVNPSFSKECKKWANEENIRHIDAPVSGTTAPAEKGELIFLVGGENKDVEEANPFFEIMGKKTVHVGKSGLGAGMKMVVNIILGQAMVGFSEAMALGRSLDISEDTILNTVLGGPLAAPFLATKKENIKSGSYDPSFPLQWMHKDFQLASQTAYENNVALPVANAAKELYGMAKREGLGEKDFSVIYEFLVNK